MALGALSSCQSSTPSSFTSFDEQLGNYLGALRNWVRLQDNAGPKDTLIFSVVGLHALTMPQNPKQLVKERRDMMAALLAIGLDPERCTIYHQDQVSAMTTGLPRQIFHLKFLHSRKGARARRARVDLELYHPSRKVESNDYLESKSPCLSVTETSVC